MTSCGLSLYWEGPLSLVWTRPKPRQRGTTGAGRDGARLLLG